MFEDRLRRCWRRSGDPSEQGPGPVIKVLDEQAFGSSPEEGRLNSDLRRGHCAKGLRLILLLMIILLGARLLPAAPMTSFATAGPLAERAMKLGKTSGCLLVSFPMELKSSPALGRCTNRSCGSTSVPMAMGKGSWSMLCGSRTPGEAAGCGLRFVLKAAFTPQSS